jgi:hypothetical protein
MEEHVLTESFFILIPESNQLLSGGLGSGCSCCLHSFYLSSSVIEDDVLTESYFILIPESNQLLHVSGTRKRLFTLTALILVLLFIFSDRGTCPDWIILHSNTRVQPTVTCKWWLGSGCSHWLHSFYRSSSVIEEHVLTESFFILIPESNQLLSGDSEAAVHIDCTHSIFHLQWQRNMSWLNHTSF